ncbi:hypothetical protein [Lysinibacillus xylanilyticus]|uniref:hypothetical protein n=1 Tax=Lysinibacillus xylanilyticus TaxID=582475 RepID=UPI003801E8E2
MKLSKYGSSAKRELISVPTERFVCINSSSKFSRITTPAVLPPNFISVKHQLHNMTKLTLLLEFKLLLIPYYID